MEKVEESIGLKKTFERKTEQVLQCLNDLETLNGQMLYRFGAAGVSDIQSKIQTARNVTQKAQNMFSTKIARKMDY